MISRPDMEIIMADLMRWCRVAMTDDQIRIMHKKLQGLNASALEYACERFMDDRKQSKAAFPTVREILNVAAEYYAMHPEQLDLEYGHYDDDRYPYQFMLQGYRVLRDVGLKAFTTFAEQMHMPLHDQERCLTKCRTAEKKKGLSDRIIQLMIERHKHGTGRKQDNKGY